VDEEENEWMGIERMWWDLGCFPAVLHEETANTINYPIGKSDGWRPGGSAREIPRRTLSRPFLNVIHYFI
jgi:hypothetical protein